MANAVLRKMMISKMKYASVCFDADKDVYIMLKPMLSTNDSSISFLINTRLDLDTQKGLLRTSNIILEIRDINVSEMIPLRNRFALAAAAGEDMYPLLH